MYKVLGARKSDSIHKIVAANDGFGGKTIRLDADVDLSTVKNMGDSLTYRFNR